jgi:hypothetical protein
MATQIADIIVPEEFTAYIVENSLASIALFQSELTTARKRTKIYTFSYTVSSVILVCY